MQTGWASEHQGEGGTNPFSPLNSCVTVGAFLGLLIFMSSSANIKNTHFSVSHED
jgi:hypothetical protein